MVRGVIIYMNAEPKLPGKRAPVPGHSPVPIRLMLACPSICPPPRKNRSIRPWPVRSNSSRVPAVNGLPVCLCSSDRRTGWPSFFTSQHAAAGIGLAAPTAMWRAGGAVGSRIRRARAAAMPFLDGGSFGGGPRRAQEARSGRR